MSLTHHKLIYEIWPGLGKRSKIPFHFLPPTPVGFKRMAFFCPLLHYFFFHLRCQNNAKGGKKRALRCKRMPFFCTVMPFFCTVSHYFDTLNEKKIMQKGAKEGHYGANLFNKRGQKKRIMGQKGGKRMPFFWPKHWHFLVGLKKQINESPCQIHP